MIQFLSGKKTYIIAVFVGLVAIGQFLGIIDPAIATVLYGLLGAGGIATTRAAIAKSAAPVQPQMYYTTSSYQADPNPSVKE